MFKKSGWLVKWTPFSTPETARRIGTNFPRIEFWDCLGRQSLVRNNLHYYKQPVTLFLILSTRMIPKTFAWSVCLSHSYCETKYRVITLVHLISDTVDPPLKSGLVFLINRMHIAYNIILCIFSMILTCVLPFLLVVTKTQTHSGVLTYLKGLGVAVTDQ